MAHPVESNGRSVAPHAKCDKKSGRSGQYAPGVSVSYTAPVERKQSQPANSFSDGCHQCSRAAELPVFFNQSITDDIPIPSRRLTLDQMTKDMEALILSRQDDPFLQALACKDVKPDDEETADDSTRLIKQGQEQTHAYASLMPEGLSIVDIHEHMIRSPPPIIPAANHWQTFQFPSSTKLKAVNNRRV